MKCSCFYLISILLFCGCGMGNWQMPVNWRIEELFVQKIEGSSKVIYKFSAWGGLDSNPNGFIILDSTDTFKVDVQNILPVYYLSDIPSNLNIEGVSHECYNSCGEEYYKSQPIFTPMKTDKSENNAIIITNRIYQYRGFSEKKHGLERYVFEGFEETNDSLVFYNLDDIESMNGIHLDELKVKKGEVYLHHDENKEIKKITIKSINENQSNNAIEFSKTYNLSPKSKTMVDEFSERGIFREVKVSQ